uniref:H/ACA ribonucleoprotein complex non-core subunit NAF1 n=1 Tax=Graphocephala atropunctata TaxID=36148 RepID=A0A1B6MTW3_9HEMI
MDNLIDFKSHEKRDGDEKSSMQSTTANDELDRSTLPVAKLNNNSSKTNENELEANESQNEKVLSVSKVYGLLYDGDEQTECGFETNQTIDYNKNSQKTDTTIGINKSGLAETKQLNSIENGCGEGVDKISMDKNSSIDAQNCVKNDSTEMSCDDALPPYENTEAAGTSNLEQLQHAAQQPLVRESFINPSPNDFDMLHEKVSPHYSTLLLNINNETDLLSLESDQSVVISNNNAIPQAESIVTSNFSLSLLKDYESDESSDGEACEVSLQYRGDKNEEEDSDKDSDSDSSSSSSSTSIYLSDSSDPNSDELYENFTVQPCKPIKARKELDLEDLPPIKDLKISVPEEDCTPIGKVFQIVDRLVVIQAFKEMPAYNLDTVLFVEGGQPLGRIFDVFGPVTEPYYCVRFNSKDHINEKKICIDQMVYCAPKTKYTNYVFLAQLMKLKGSDASWEDDVEPPEIHLEYSDDEQEQRAKKKRSKNRNRKAVFRVDSDPDEPARKRHFDYEKKMNERNLQLTAVRNIQSGTKNRMQRFNNLWSPAIAPPGSAPQRPGRSPVRGDASHQMFGRPPMFGGRIPPHNVPVSLIPRPDQCNFMRTPPPRFGSPDTSNFSRRPPPNRPDNSPGLPNKTSNHSYSFAPNHLQSPNNYPRWTPPFSRNENPWENSFPARDEPVTNNNPLPSSPFWSQMPPPSPNVPTPFSTLPNIPFVPLCPPPRPFWPTQSPPQSRNVPYNNPSHINFNPNLPPPPSSNYFNR